MKTIGNYIRAAMKRRIVLGIAGIAACFLVIYSVEPLRNAMAQAQRKPITVNRIYAGSDGLAHWERNEMPLGASATAAGMEQSQQFKDATVFFVRRPPSVVQDWHANSAPQYAVTISGSGEIEVAGGQKVVIETGSVLLVEDMGSKGHKTRTLGNEDWTLMVTTLPRK